MICKDLEAFLPGKTFQFRTPLLECANDRKKFFVPNLIIQLCGLHRFREEGNRVPEVVDFMVLGEYGTDNSIRGICFYTGLKAQIVVS